MDFWDFRKPDAEGLGEDVGNGGGGVDRVECVIGQNTKSVNNKFGAKWGEGLFFTSLLFVLIFLASL